MPYISNTERERIEMLRRIGVKSFDELLSPIPEHLRLKEPLKLSRPLSEFEVKKLMSRISQKNLTTENCISFLGAGCYNHYIPAVVDSICSRPEFYTAYTPYQPEASQGTLQTIYEYQSMICELTGMDVTNASMYDGATALAEACLMAISIKKKDKILISEGVNPEYRLCVETYLGKEKIESIPLKSGQTDIETLKELFHEDVACVVVQHPNFFGIFEPVDKIKTLVSDALRGEPLYIAVSYPISLGILKPPGIWGADIVAAEGQSLGIAQSFGGPALGILATHKKFIRQMPGRIIGRTKDANGREGFVMTLQTREQHIRREQATSNICTNEGLCTIAACVYLTIMGPQGLKEVAELCYKKAHYLAQRISEIKGFNLVYNAPFFNEFLIQTPIPAEELAQSLTRDHIFAGVPLSRFSLWEASPDADNQGEYQLLIAVTEKRTRDELDYFVEKLKIFSA